MLDFAYDKNIVQKTESFVALDMNLDDIRESYGIDERESAVLKTHDCATLVIHLNGEKEPLMKVHVPNR